MLLTRLAHSEEGGGGLDTVLLGVGLYVLSLGGRFVPDKRGMSRQVVVVKGDEMS